MLPFKFICWEGKRLAQGMAAQPTQWCLVSGMGGSIQPSCVKTEKVDEDDGKHAAPKATTTHDAPGAIVDHPRAATDPGSGATAARAPLSANKERYNKFNYHLRNASDELRNQWKVVKSQEDVDPESFDCFVDMVLSLPASERSRKKRKIEDIKSSKKEEAWTCWKEAADKEGEEILLEQIHAGTLQCRKHPGLPADSKIPWPKNQQVRRVIETTAAIVQHTDEDQSETRNEGSALYQASERFESAWAAKQVFGQSGHAVASVSSAASSTDITQHDGASVKKGRAAVQHIRKAHSAWDRSQRELGGILGRSSQHPNTKGCKLESDLRKLIDNGNKYDQDLVNVERKFLLAIELSDDDSTVAASLTTTVKQTIKDGNNIATAINQWMKV